MVKIIYRISVLNKSFFLTDSSGFRSCSYVVQSIYKVSVCSQGISAMENQNNEENKKKKKSPFYTVAIVGFVLSFIFLIVVHGIPYAPAGTVIDDVFLNTLKGETGSG